MNYLCNPYHPIYRTQGYPHIDRTVSIVNDLNQAQEFRIYLMDVHGLFSDTEWITLKAGTTYTYTIPYDVRKIRVDTRHPGLPNTWCSLPIVRGQKVTLKEIWQDGHCMGRRD